MQVNINTGGTTSTTNMWGIPKMESVREMGETIEMVFTEESLYINAALVYPTPPPAKRVFKIIYSCKDGKWDKSDRIYGDIYPAQAERYDFEQLETYFKKNENI